MMQEGQQESETSMMDMLEMSLRQINQICDWHLAAKCNLHNMHSSCEKFLEGTVPAGDDTDPKESLVEIEEECGGRESCRSACNGVDSFITDFTLGQFKMNMAFPLPNLSLGMQHCKQVDHLLTCTKQ